MKSLQEQLASSIAGAMMEAYMSMEPVKIGLGISDLVGLTRNRRCKLSPFLECDSIDPNLGLEGLFFSLFFIDDSTSFVPVTMTTNQNIQRLR